MTNKDVHEIYKQIIAINELVMNFMFFFFVYMYVQMTLSWF